MSKEIDNRKRQRSRERERKRERGRKKDVINYLAEIRDTFFDVVSDAAVPAERTRVDRRSN